MDQIITLTKCAAQKILETQKDTKKQYAQIRFGIRGGGCSGYSYVFEYAYEHSAFDIVDEQFGVKIIIDPKSAMYVTGTVIDFYPGIREHGFKFLNPNIDNTCGCGKSIQFK